MLEQWQIVSHAPANKLMFVVALLVALSSVVFKVIKIIIGCSVFNACTTTLPPDHQWFNALVDICSVWQFALSWMYCVSKHSMLSVIKIFRLSSNASLVRFFLEFYEFYFYLCFTFYMHVCVVVIWQDVLCHTVIRPAYTRHTRLISPHWCLALAPANIHPICLRDCQVLLRSPRISSDYTTCTKVEVLLISSCFEFRVIYSGLVLFLFSLSFCSFRFRYDCFAVSNL